MPRGASGLVVIPLIWFYTAATGWQASAIRSTVMMSIVITGWALERPSHLINSLAAAGLIILIWDPAQLYQAGFQLSFFVVLGIALLVPPLESARARLLRPDPLLPPELRPRWKRWLDLPLRAVSASLATSLAAWLGSTPLIAWYFCMVTPGSLLANVFIVPLSSLALMSSLGSLVCGDWLPLATELFNHGSWFWMTLMVKLSEWFAGFPGAYFYVPQPSLVFSAGYYLVVGGVLSGIVFTQRWRKWSCAGALAVAVGWLAWAWAGRDAIRLTILPIRGGAAFLDEPGSRRDLLVDCGDADAFQWALKPFLRSQGVNRLSSLLLTHGDVAHAGSAELVRNQFRIREIFASSAPFRSKVYRDLIADLQRMSAGFRQVVRSDKVGRWTLLHPSAEDRFPQGANNAMAMRCELHGAQVLLLSDLGRLGQRALLGREPHLQTDIMIAGLTTNGDALGDALVRAANPRILIVACSDFPASSAPSRKLRDRLAGLGIPVIYTSDSGAAVLTFRPDGWTLRTMDGNETHSAAPSITLSEF